MAKRGNTMGQIMIRKISHYEISIESDRDLSEDFYFQLENMKYDYKEKSYVKEAVNSYYGRSVSPTKTIFGMGWLPYLYYHYYKELDQGSKDLYAEQFTGLTLSFDNLRRDQLDDFGQLLKFNRGIFPIYTGYGKTECTATLINWIVNTRNEYIIVLTPNDSSRKEVLDRVSDKFGIDATKFSYDSKFNCVNVNGFLRSKEFDPSSEYWRKITWILSDEVEHCVTSKAINCIKLCTNVKYIYGMSATTDKKYADRIAILPARNPMLGRNKTLIDYFGFATVYKKPKGQSIKMITVRSNQFRNVHIPDKLFEKGYAEVIKEIFYHREVKELIKKVSLMNKPMFIPLNRLEILDNWRATAFSDPGVSLLILCGRSYEHYISGNLVASKLKLKEIKALITNQKIDVVLGTKTAFRAIDFHGMQNILLLASNQASTVVQCIGRVARSVSYNIFQIESLDWVPIYSLDFKKRKSLIKSYYEDCTITEEIKTDNHFGLS
jgi:hypothetical protein